MTVHLVRFDDVPPQPWRNGGGVTRELLAWPTAADWALRLSVADIARDGPFSAFAGVERWFAVLTGEGVRLGSPGALQRPGGDVLRFDGALAPDCALVGGTTRDLNLMLRRDRAEGWMTRVAPGFAWPDGPCVTAALRGVFSREGCALRVGDEAVVRVPPMSLAWRAEAPAGPRWRVEGDADDGSTYAIECRFVTA